jgi:hypothetical protein
VLQNRKQPLFYNMSFTSVCIGHERNVPRPTVRVMLGVASVVAAPSVTSGTGTNCPHPNHIMTDFFIKTIVPTMPRSSPGSERVVSGSSQEDQTAAGSETANDTVSSRGASCCTSMLLVATTAAVAASVILLPLLLVSYFTKYCQINRCSSSLSPLWMMVARWKTKLVFQSRLSARNYESREPVPREDKIRPTTRRGQKSKSDEIVSLRTDDDENSKQTDESKNQKEEIEKLNLDDTNINEQENTCLMSGNIRYG